MITITMPIATAAVIGSLTVLVLIGLIVWVLLLSRARKAEAAKAAPDRTALREECEERLKAMAEDCESRLMGLRSECEERIRAVRDECGETIDSMKKDCEQEISVLTRNQEAELNAAKELYDVNLKAAEQACARKIEEVKEGLKKR